MKLHKYHSLKTSPTPITGKIIREYNDIPYSVFEFFDTDKDLSEENFKVLMDAFERRIPNIKEVVNYIMINLDSFGRVLVTPCVFNEVDLSNETSRKTFEENRCTSILGYYDVTPEDISQQTKDDNLIYKYRRINELSSKEFEIYLKYYKLPILDAFHCGKMALSQDTMDKFTEKLMHFVQLYDDEMNMRYVKTVEEFRSKVNFIVIGNRPIGDDDIYDIFVFNTKVDLANLECNSPEFKAFEKKYAIDICGLWTLNPVGENTLPEEESRKGKIVPILYAHRGAKYIVVEKDLEIDLPIASPIPVCMKRNIGSTLSLNDIKSLMELDPPLPTLEEMNSIEDAGALLLVKSIFKNEYQLVWTVRPMHDAQLTEKDFREIIDTNKFSHIHGYYKLLVRES